MTEKRKFLVDVDEGSKVIILTTEIDNVEDEEIADEVYELVEGYLRGLGISYTYFNPIDITSVSEVEL